MPRRGKTLDLFLLLSAGMHRLRHEEGSIAALAAGLISIILVPLCLLLLYSGKLHVAKAELQNAADALALAGAASLREQGLSDTGAPVLSQQAVNTAVREHTGREVTGSLQLLSRDDDPYALIRVRLETTVRSLNPFASTSQKLDATAHARVRQRLLARRWPVVVIAADVSPSMNDRTGNTTNFQLLRSMLLQYASSPLPVRNGLVLFNGGIAKVVKPPVAQMSNIEAFRQAITPETIGTGSDVGGALNKSRELLQPFNHPDTQRNVILISDAMANRGSWAFWTIGDVVANAAQRLRNLATTGAALHSIEMLENSTLTDVGTWMMGCSGLLKRIAGGPKSSGADPHFYQGVRDYSQISAFLDRLSSWVCSFGPLELELDQRQLLGVFFRTASGSEYRLDAVSSSSPAEGYQLASTLSGDYVAVTRTNCYALGRDPRNRLVLRWGPASLTAAPTAEAPADAPTTAISVK